MSDEANHGDPDDLLSRLVEAIREETGTVPTVTNHPAVFISAALLSDLGEDNTRQLVLFGTVIGQTTNILTLPLIIEEPLVEYLVKVANHTEEDTNA